MLVLVAALLEAEVVERLLVEMPQLLKKVN